jgi:POT family proton-dependent oligopeptide transporter
MVAFMFGVYYLAIAIGNKLAHYIGGDIEKITQEYSLSTFYLIFTIVPILIGIISLLLHPLLKKLMHGIK